MDFNSPYLRDVMVGVISKHRDLIKDFRININSDYGSGGFVWARLDFEVLVTPDSVDLFQFPHKFQPTGVKENSDEDSD